MVECKSIKDDAQEQADALIMFSCVSRYLSFGMVMKDEIECAMAGFFPMANMENQKPVKMSITIKHAAWWH